MTLLAQAGECNASGMRQPAGGSDKFGQRCAVRAAKQPEHQFGLAASAKCRFNRANQISGRIALAMRSVSAAILPGGGRRLPLSHWEAFESKMSCKALRRVCLVMGAPSSWGTLAKEFGLSRSAIQRVECL